VGLVTLPIRYPGVLPGTRPAADVRLVLTRLRSWMPTGGGLRHQDWVRRHRVLTLLLAMDVVGLIGFGGSRDGLSSSWVYAALAVLVCVVAGAKLPGRRLPAVAVALGFATVSAGYVSVANGLTEAHFAFFIAVAALALYRDWAPFLVFLIATVLHHAVFGALAFDRTYDHHGGSGADALYWALWHGFAVLLASAFQVVQWRLTEADERRAKAHLDESQAQLGIAFDQTPVPMAMIAPDGVLLRTNSAYRRWLRLPDELPAGFAVPDLPIVTDASGSAPFADELRNPGSRTRTRRFRRPDSGELLWVEVHSTALTHRDGTLRHLFVHCVDVTQNYRHQEELRRQVRHDSLTGLLSRAAFETDLRRLLGTGDTPVSVIYLDVDRFKSINDGSGHTTGDAVLRAIAERLQPIVESGALVARLGGDEFVVALAGDSEAGERVGEGILAAFDEPLRFDGNQVPLSISAGVATMAGAENADEAVLGADTAMYAAKREGGNRLKVYNELMRVGVHERIASEQRLRQALAGDREHTLPVWFQPIVRAATGEVVGAETLVRMRAPDGSILGPGQFIPAAEETGLIVPLGEHVLTMALRHLLDWSDELGYVSVNVSPRQLAEPDFVPLLAGLLAAAPQLDPGRLVLEITETALLGSSVDVQERLALIKELGVRIALDDFGTGYSSLTWLQSIPADVVKLDRSFVAGLATDGRKASIISAVLWLARSLGMSVVAEGVEEEADWHALVEADCPSIQGYLFGRPLPPEDFAAASLNGSRMVTTS
jgi:diguanylate cyclase (GGDEF)-like protein/PAS domain S-box-containing protein